MAAAQRQRLRVLQKALRPLGVFFRFHGCSDAPLLRRSPVPAPIHLLELGVDDVSDPRRLVARRRRLCRALRAPCRSAGGCDRWQRQRPPAHAGLRSAAASPRTRAPSCSCCSAVWIIGLVACLDHLAALPVLLACCSASLRCAVCSPPTSRPRHWIRIWRPVAKTRASAPAWPSLRVRSCRHPARGTAVRRSLPRVTLVAYGRRAPYCAAAHGAWCDRSTTVFGVPRRGTTGCVETSSGSSRSASWVLHCCARRLRGLRGGHGGGSGPVRARAAHERRAA